MANIRGKSAIEDYGTPTLWATCKGNQGNVVKSTQKKRLVLRSTEKSYGRTWLSAERRWWFKKQNKIQRSCRHLFWLNRSTENVLNSLMQNRPQQGLVISCSWGFIRLSKRCLELHAWQGIQQLMGSITLNRIYSLNCSIDKYEGWIGMRGKELRALFCEIVRKLRTRHLGESIGKKKIQNFGQVIICTLELTFSYGICIEIEN